VPSGRVGYNASSFPSDDGGECATSSLPNLENTPVSKFTIGCLLALSVAVFISGCGREQPAPANAPDAPPAAMPAPPPHPIPAAPVGTVDLSGIEAAEGGRTIAEVFADKDQLAGETVVFRGRIVKANAGIMGKNWLHIRDGSGAEGTNNLTVTTIDVLPNVGDTVLVSGVIELNKDFGMGYQYDLIIENADVTVETPAAE
jgi:hypothetical protein